MLLVPPRIHTHPAHGRIPPKKTPKGMKLPSSGSQKSLLRNGNCLTGHHGASHHHGYQHLRYIPRRVYPQCHACDSWCHRGPIVYHPAQYLLLLRQVSRHRILELRRRPLMHLQKRQQVVHHVGHDRHQNIPAGDLTNRRQGDGRATASYRCNIILRSAIDRVLLL